MDRLSYISARLDSLARLRATIEDLRGNLERLNEDCIPNEIQEVVAELRGRILELERPYRESARPRISELESEIIATENAIGSHEIEIKEVTVEIGQSVRGANLQAVYSSPRALWDDKALRGYAAGGHPEILEFRSLGKASASIRPVNGKGAGHDE